MIRKLLIMLNFHLAFQIENHFTCRSTHNLMNAWVLHMLSSFIACVQFSKMNQDKASEAISRW